MLEKEYIELPQCLQKERVTAAERTEEPPLRKQEKQDGVPATETCSSEQPKLSRKEAKATMPTTHAPTCLQRVEKAQQHQVQALQQQMQVAGQQQM